MSLTFCLADVLSCLYADYAFLATNTREVVAVSFSVHPGDTENFICPTTNDVNFKHQGYKRLT